MNELIRKILLQRFESGRIICWRDENGEFAMDFAMLGLPEEIVVLKVEKNEFGIQHRVLREEKDKKFLLYVSGKCPSDEENWLLNLEETFGRFSAERSVLLAEEAGLGSAGAKFVREHEKFFASKERLAELKKRLVGGESDAAVCLKMLGVIVGGDGTFEGILHELIDEAAAGRGEKAALVRGCALDGFLWKECEKRFDYVSVEPSVRDFVYIVFRYAYYAALDEIGRLDEKSRLNNDAVIFLERWKDSAVGEKSFREWSGRVGADFLIAEDLRVRDLAEMPSVDYFLSIDEFVLNEVALGLCGKTRAPEECVKMLRAHSQTFWKELHGAYAALEAGARFMEGVRATEYGMPSASDGFARYRDVYWEVDSLYRRFVHGVRLTEECGTEPVKEALHKLKDMIDKMYANEFLAKLGSAWQSVLDGVKAWPIEGVPSQTRFYAREVAGAGKKMFVVISDAFRYEVAKEFAERLMREDRFKAEVDAMCGVLPSYTTLGMAALLPHKTLEIASDGRDVLADGMSTRDSQAREKVLRSAAEKSAVVKAEEVLKMSVAEVKALYRDNSVVYVYHNVIDNDGHKPSFEGKVFDAADRTIRELMLLVRKLTSGNAFNLIVTADHGFIYQDMPLTKDQFMSEAVGAAEVWKNTRRYVIGRGLKPQLGLQGFSSESLGLVGDCEVQVAKGMHRLHESTTGSRYVHGGASLQEIVVPVVRVRKFRADDTHQVEVAVLVTARTITTSQHIVKFYQQERVEGKALARTVRVGLYAPDGVTALSNVAEVVFDSAAEDVREREKTCTLILNSEADRHNNKQVMLRVETLQVGTTQYAPYQTQPLTLRRYVSFEREFD